MNIHNSGFFVQVDPKENVLMDKRLSRLFPDKNLRVSLPKPNWHMPEGQHTDRVEVSISPDHKKILVRAFDKAGTAIDPNFGKGTVEIPVKSEDPHNMRFQIQYALGRFHGLPHAYQRYGGKLKHLDL